MVSACYRLGNGNAQNAGRCDKRAVQTQSRLGRALKELRCILGTGCLSAWFWLVLRSYGDPEPFLFNDEFGRLFAVLPCAGVFLFLLGLCRERLCAGETLARLWSAGCIALCGPVLLSLDFFSHTVGEAVVSVLGGFGFAVGFVILSLSAASFSRSGLLVTAGGSILAGRALIHGILALQPENLALLPVVFSLAARLLLEPPVMPALQDEDALSAGKASEPPGSGLLCLVYALTGFSHGLYYSLLAVMEPLLPRPKPYLLLIAAASCLLSLLCLSLARRGSVWRTVLLMGPLLVMGYMAWPLLHRESPALSLDSLHFAYALLSVYTCTTLFYAASRLAAHSPGEGIRFVGLGGAILLFSLLSGTFALSGIRASFSHGTTVNSLFALLAVAIVLSSWAYVFLLERMGFWALFPHGQARPAWLLPIFPSSLAEKMPQEQCMQEENPLPPKASNLEECERFFRQMGLTRQQALIAAMLAQKRQDADICASLNISPHTLKTHIRNILRRLGISSRHELPWLAFHAGGQGTES